MSNKIELVKNFYNKEYKEENRIDLVDDYRHRIERELKYKMIKELIPNNPKKILDMSCGVGVYTKMLSKDFPNAIIYAIDLSERNIEKVQELNLPNVETKIMDASEKINTFNNQFDFTLIAGAYYHIEDEIIKAKVVSNAHEYTKKGKFVMVDFLPKIHREINVIRKKHNFEDKIFIFDDAIKISNDFEKYGKVKFFSPDSISRFMQEEMKQWNEEDYQRWKKWVWNSRLTTTADNVNICEHASFYFEVK